MVFNIRTVPVCHAPDQRGQPGSRAACCRCCYIVRHGKQFTKLQLSDILYQLSSHRIGSGWLGSVQSRSSGKRDNGPVTTPAHHHTTTPLSLPHATPLSRCTG